LPRIVIQEYARIRKLVQNGIMTRSRKRVLRRPDLAETK